MVSGQILSGLLLGGMVYVTGLVAPIIFIVLEDPEATEFTRTMWPRYFTINAVIALLAGVLITIGSMNPYLYVPLFLTAGVMAINWELARRMRTMRDPGDDYDEETPYAWMHKFTVWTNALSILLVGASFSYGLYL